MNSITLDDISLKDYTFESIPLLGQLKEEHFKTKSEVCIERARYVTRYLRDNSEPSVSMEIKYANAIKYFLSNKTPLFFDDNLLAGTTTSKHFGAPLYPELTGMTIWPELDTISDRKQNPQKLMPEDAEELNFDIFPYWMERNILEYTRKKYNNPACMGLFEQFVFFIATKSGCISHTIPYYELVLEKGVLYIIKEAERYVDELEKKGRLSPEDTKKLDFYRAVKISMDGVIAYAENMSKKAKKLAEENPDRKEHFLKIAEVCAQVPAGPARTFREAVNSIWIVQVSIHAENINMAMSPGRLDQVLYKYYKNDIEKGELSIKEAIELVGCLWLKLADNTNLVPETAEELFGGAGTVPAVTLGGVSKDGEDAVNDLTYIMLRVTELLKTRDPSLNARYHYEKNSDAYRDRVAEVIVNTKAVPAFHNDVSDVKTLVNQGLTLEHARDYAVIGCVELGSSGRSYNSSSSIMFNLVSALELTGNPGDFKTFEEFWEAFKKQISWLIGEAIQLNEYFGKVHQEILPTPLLSAFFEGPMEKGKNLIFGGAVYNSSGATHIGFADTVDSLNAIEKAVFIDKKCTFPELIKAIEDNFENHEKLHTYLVNKAPKYGTEDSIARKNAQNLVGFLYKFYQGHTNYRGGKYRPAYWTMTNHAGQGKLSGALPNGRKANKVFASGITPSSQAAPDLLVCLKEIGRLDSDCIPGGEALNLKYPEVRDKEDMKKFGEAIEAYFRSGGLHVQFNIMSYEELMEAKKYPDKYPELLVRVSGYSAYFNDLNEAMKDEIITRTAYDLKKGKAVRFPKEHEYMLSSE